MRKRSMPAPVAIAAVIVLGLAWIPAAEAQTAVAVFDPQRVSEETAEGKRLAAMLEAMRDRKQKELSDQEQAISTLQEQLQAQSLSLSAEKRREMEVQIQRKLMEINVSKDLAERSLQFEAANAQASFNEKLIQVIDQYGRDSEFKVILAVEAVAWASQSVDVTTAVIDVFDKMFPAKSAAP